MVLARAQQCSEAERVALSLGAYVPNMGVGLVSVWDRALEIVAGKRPRQLPNATFPLLLRLLRMFRLNHIGA